MAKTPIRFQGLNLAVQDMARSVAFYRALGLAFTLDSGPHVDAKNIDTSFDLDHVDFVPKWNSGWKAGHHIGFEVDRRADVDALYAQMIAQGYKGQQPPIDAFWGKRYAVIEDPDGTPVGIMSAEAGPRGPVPE